MYKQCVSNRYETWLLKFYNNYQSIISGINHCHEALTKFTDNNDWSIFSISPNQPIYIPQLTNPIVTASTVQNHPTQFTEPDELSTEPSVGALAAVEGELVSAGPTCTEPVEMVDE